MKANSAYIKDLIVKQKGMPYFVQKRLKQWRQANRLASVNMGRHQALLDNGKVKIYSFDVFDSVLTRRTGKPESVFDLMKQRLMDGAMSFPEAMVKNFVSLRMEAEQFARDTVPHEEVTLFDIYHRLAKTNQLSQAMIDHLIALEQELQLELAEPITEIIDLIQKLRRKNARIIFVSDTYLPEEHIKKMLIKVGAYTIGDGLYVSNTHLQTKDTGHLFDLVIQREQCRPHQIVHVGDNLQKDVYNARKKGIKGLYFSSSLFNQYEKSMIGSSERTSSNFALRHQWAGFSRLARMNANTDTAKSVSLHKIGANVAGPALLGFILWVLKKAKEDKLQRLYFIARDGQILKRIADSVAAKLDTGIQLKYIYGSRQAWMLPMTTEINEAELGWILSRYPYLTIEMIAKKVDLEPRIIQKNYQSQYKILIPIQKHLSEAEIKRMGQLLSAKSLATLILEKAEESRRAFMEYLDQEGLMGQAHWAMVDLGWKGNLQKKLRKALDLAGEETKTIHGYYYGLSQEHTAHNSQYSVYYFDADRAKQNHKILANGVKDMLEIVTAADHGMTLGYFRNLNDQWVPQLKIDQNKPILDWGLNDLRAGIMDYVNQFTKEDLKQLQENLPVYRGFIFDVLNEFLSHPSAEESRIMGDHPFTGDQTETDIRAYAPAFSVSMALKYPFTCDKRGMTSWFQASRARSGRLAQCILSSKVQFLLRKIRWYYMKIVSPKTLLQNVDWNSVLDEEEESNLAYLAMTLSPWEESNELIQQFTRNFVAITARSPKEQVKLFRYKKAIKQLNRMANKHFNVSQFKDLSPRQRQTVVMDNIDDDFFNTNAITRTLRRVINSPKEQIRILAVDVMIYLFEQFMIPEKANKTMLAFAQTLIPWSTPSKDFDQWVADEINVTTYRRPFRLKNYYQAVYWLDAKAKKRFDAKYFFYLSPSQREELLRKETWGRLTERNKVQRFLWKVFEPSMKHVQVLAGDILLNFYEHPMAYQYLKEGAQ